MSAKKTGVAIGLLLIDLGVFAGTIAFLPQRGSFGHSGLLSYFINSRARWDIAWCVLVAAIILTVGVYLLLGAFGAFDRDSKSAE